MNWLLGLQNKDGGIPTFCRGWGKLPFDRSSADLTAHALCAWRAWERELPPRVAGRLADATARAERFLASGQSRSGAWLPLWFGNQHAGQDENPTYGTSRVLLAVGHPEMGKDSPGAGVHWLLALQNPDGGWGGGDETPSTIEETALAVEALAGLPADANHSTAVGRGTAWLIEHTDRGRSFPPSPIGFYFAKLWYWEALYPLIWTVAALESVPAARPSGQDPD